MGAGLLPRAQEPSKFAADMIYWETDFASRYRRLEEMVSRSDYGGTARELQEWATRYYLMNEPRIPRAVRLPRLSLATANEPILDTDSVVVYMDPEDGIEGCCAVVFDPSYGAEDFRVGLIADVRTSLCERPMWPELPSYRSEWDNFMRYRELFDAIPIPLLVVRPPRIEFTDDLSNGDRIVADDGFVSAGLFATRGGRLGVVTVDHGIPNGAQSVTVDTGVASFTLPVHDIIRDQTWDAAWIPLAEGVSASYRAPVRAWTPGEDRVAPGAGLRCEFFAAVTRPGRARVQITDPYIMHYNRYFVQRVYTERGTQPGDSGSVLFGNGGLPLGLGSFRTRHGEFMPMSGWMYMPGVLAALDAELYLGS